MTVEIVALDPGTTTGIAVYQNGKYRAFETRSENYPHPHESLYDILSALKPKVLVYEQFHFRQGMDGAVFKGIEYIGVIELWAQLNYVDVSTITTSDGKGFWDDKKLKAVGVYQKSLGHGMDATRILFRYRMKTDKTFMEQMLPILKEKL